VVAGTVAYVGNLNVLERNIQFRAGTIGLDSQAYTFPVLVDEDLALRRARHRVNRRITGIKKVLAKILPSYVSLQRHNSTFSKHGSLDEDLVDEIEAFRLFLRYAGIVDIVFREKKQ
jgi:hypothetical protein